MLDSNELMSLDRIRLASIAPHILTVFLPPAVKVRTGAMREEWLTC